MALSNEQTTKLYQVWDYYIENGERFRNASREYSSQELDQKRRDLIPTLLGLLNKFLHNEVDLENFKKQVDGINKKNRLWGFMAINGQMFFNMLTRSAKSGNITQELVRELQDVLLVPGTTVDAKLKLSKWEQFVRDLRQYSADGRGAPRAGSIPYFTSYFWQLQKPDIFPVYYTSMVEALQHLEIWSPSKNVVNDYLDFYELTHLMLKKLTTKYGGNLKIWDVEHAFWLQHQILTQGQEGATRPPDQPQGGNAQPINNHLPDSYVPPIVSVLPKLALNDPELIRICHESGKAIEKVFEERLAVLFGMLGFETELLGQGRGRVPDGVAVSDEFRYAVIYDAKIRENGYSIGTDERAIKEYINSQVPRLRHRGITTIYYSIISSTFNGNNDAPIPGIKIETGINEVNLIEIKALMAMLEAKLKNPAITLGRYGIQMLFASSGVLSENRVREFLQG